MEPYEYATMAALEDTFWWYRGIHGAIADMLRGAGVGAQARILDAGCGTGGNIASLRRQFASEPFGFDFSSEASRFWGDRNMHRAAIASINEIPYASNSFDAVTSIDVLESDAVDEGKAVAELCRVTRPGGVLLLVVPAYRWLLTEEHHRAVHASRRYTRPEAVALLHRHAVQVIRATHFFALLFPAIAAYRLMLQRTQQASEQPHSELKPLPTPINEALTTLMRFERRLLRSFDLPFGSSILVLGRKAG
jgi:SAM-dependent methyltransferase